MLKKLFVFVGSIFVGVVFSGVLVFFLSVLFGIPFEELINLEKLNSENELAIKISVGLQHLGMFTLSALIYSFFIHEKNWLRSFSFGHVNGGFMTKFILLWVVALPAIGASAALFEYIQLPEWLNSIDESSIESLMSLLKMDGPLDLLLNLVIIAVLPAIGEELIFRGIIQKELVGRLRNPHVAIFVASFIFSAVHLQVAGFLPKFFIGLILGYSFYWTKSLWYPIVLHFINNGFQTVLLYFSSDEMIENSELSGQLPSPLILLITFGISCLLCGLVVQNILEALPEEKESETA